MKGLDRYITGNYGEDQFASEQPCEVCGYWADDCICPECPTCALQGNPACYQEHDEGICGGLYETGKTWDQMIGRQELEVDHLKGQLVDATMYLDWLKDKKEQEEAENVHNNVPD